MTSPQRSVPPPNRGGRRAKPRPAPGRVYVSLTEAVEYTGLSDKTLRRIIAAGKLKTYRYGTRVLKLKLADLDAIFTTDG